MATGSSPTEKRQSTNQTSPFQDRRVVINWRYDGLTILVVEQSRKSIVRIFETSWSPTKLTHDLLQHAKSYFELQSFSFTPAHSVHWIFSFSKFTLLPDVLFHQGDGTNLLKNTSRLEIDEVVHSDFWTSQDLVAVYALPPIIKEFALSQFKKSTLAHCGHSFNALHQLQSHKDEFCHLQISSSFAEMYIVQNGKFLFFNQFNFQSFEDLLYLVLAALEQNRVLAPEVTLKYAGKIQKGDDLYKMLSTYIGKVDEIGIPAGSSSVKTIAPNQLRRNAHLIATL